LLAITVLGGNLYVLNMSDPHVRRSMGDAASPFRRIVDALRGARPVVNELLAKLREIAARGFVRTLRAGPTGVGMTLETMLGIAANSARTPDFHGIELKAKRHRASAGINRSTLFSKAPSWKLSPVGSAMGLLQKRGYLTDGRLQLYQTLSGDRLNGRRLALEIDGSADWLKQVHIDAETQRITHDVTWELDKLRADLAAKHAETFWVRAVTRGRADEEEFHYVEVSHTRRPMVRNLAALVEAGVITVDYLLHLDGTRVRDHGYLFKIHPGDMDALFPR
jgi:hypothetical protein